MTNVSWIRLEIDMFDNKKIRHIRKLPEGNYIVLIWMMLLTMAGRCNSNGIIFLTENIPYTNKMLADELDFDESVIELALTILEKFGMIPEMEHCFQFPDGKSIRILTGLKESESRQENGLPSTENARKNYQRKNVRRRFQSRLLAKKIKSSPEMFRK